MLQTPATPFFSLVVTCFNEEPHLYKNLQLLADYFKCTHWKIEFILIDDHSEDNSVMELKRGVKLLVDQGFNVVSRVHHENKGRGARVQEGFLLATGKYVGFIDIDLENPLDSLIPILLRLEREQDCDGIIAHRYTEMTVANMIRFISSSTYCWLIHLLFSPTVRDTEAGLKVFRRESILPVLSRIHDQRWFWDTEICLEAANAGLILKDHPIVFVHNPGKQSTVKLFRDIYRYFVSIWEYRKRIQGARVL